MAEEPKDRVGRVEHFYRKVKVAVIEVERPIRLGDWLHIKGAHDNVRMRVKSMQVDHKQVEAAKPGDKVGIRVPRRAHQGSVVYQAEGKPGFLARLLSWG